MADEADAASEDLERMESASIESIRNAAADIPKGEAGECSRCGEESPRLVGGACARCRDKYDLD